MSDNRKQLDWKQVAYGAGVLVAGIGLCFGAVQRGFKAIDEVKPSVSAAPKPPEGATEAVEKALRKSQEVEFTVVYVDPGAYANDPDKLNEVLKPYFIEAKDGGQAAQKIADMTKRMSGLGHRYGKESGLTWIKFDSVAFPTPDTAEVHTREAWHLPLYDAHGLTDRKADIVNPVTYTLRKSDGQWYVEDALNHYK